MMKEGFMFDEIEFSVSLLIAKELLKKGIARPYDQSSAVPPDWIKFYTAKKDFPLIASPSLDVVHKWLRDEHNIFIQIHCCASGYLPEVMKTNGTTLDWPLYKGPNDGGVWDSYESALHYGINKAFDYIKSDKPAFEKTVY